jgi:outer membrane protein assembly factor BamD (BamD/ComL family)
MARFEFLATIGITGLMSAGNALGCGPWYEAPAPTLDYYIKQVPGKSFGEIVGHAAIDKTYPVAIDNAIDDLGKKFTLSAKPSDRVRAVDEWLAKARANGSPDTDLNLLETVRDAAATEGVSAEELTAFAQWRQQHAGWFSSDTADVDHSQDVKDQLDKASPALKPCWMYLAGATLFFSGPVNDSEGWFDRVLAQKEKSPSSEIALYMKGRCWWLRAHSAQPDKEAGDNARKWFHHYLELYPSGRFAADAWGWLGGLEADDAQALADFANQAESTDHPEVFASAESEVERIFSNLDYTTGDTGFDEVAQHPELALALTYVIVGTVTTPLPADDSYSPPAPEDQARLEKWRATALPKLATAVLAHKNLYRGAVGEDKYLTILAHAASDHGDQDKALDLIHMSEKDGQPSDDFLFVQGLVLQRAGQLTEAVKSYHQLLDQFPKSMLVPGTSYRLALALHDLKQDGQALLLLATLSDDKLPILYPTNEQDNVLPGLSPAYFRPVGNSIYYAVQSYPGANASQIRQTIDAILNFAPVESLAALLKETDPVHDIFRQQLREVVVTRFLAQDDFISAARYVGDPALETEFIGKGAQDGKLEVVKSSAPRNAAPVDQPHPALAAGALDLGAYWEAHRFQFTSLPLNPRFTRDDYFVNECELLRLQKNGEFLSYGKTEVAHDLDSRDELSHAEACWRKADDLDPHGEMAPKALWKTMQAQRMIAEENPYALQRAIDTHVAEDVKNEYDRLTREFPNSIAAKKYAAYWTMPDPGELYDFQARYPLRDKYPGYDSALNHYGHPQWFLALKIPFEDDQSVPTDSWQQVSDQLRKLPSTSGNETQTEFSQTVTDLRKRAGPLAVLLNRALEINCLDDLVDLGTVPNLDPAVRTGYITARLNLLSVLASETSGYFENPGNPAAAIASPLEGDPKAQPIADFIDAFNLSKNANDPAQLTDLAQTFLQKYPQSIKRELAAFYRIRGTLNAPPPAGGAQRNFDALDAAFGDYAKEFPQGKLAHGVLWMQGQEEVMKKHWGPAAHDFALLLDQNEAPELKQDSAYQLALIFDQLKDDDLRHATLEAVLADPLVQAKLKAYVACGELPFLKDFLIARAGP